MNNPDSRVKLGLSGYDISFYSIRVGYQHFIYNNTAFIYTEAGINNIVSKYKNTYNPYKNSFTYAAGGGYKFTVKEKNFLQLSMYYNHNNLFKYDKHNYFTLKAAYGFVLKKKMK